MKQKDLERETLKMQSTELGESAVQDQDTLDNQSVSHDMIDKIDTDIIDKIDAKALSDTPEEDQTSSHAWDILFLIVLIIVVIVCCYMLLF